MKTSLAIFCTLVFSLLLVSCKEDPAKKIPDLEAAYAASRSVPAADSLLQYYLAAVEAHPNNHADNLNYLSRAAGIKLGLKKDVVGAVRLLNEALETHGEGQNRTEPIEQLALIWNAYKHRATPDLSRNPDDIDLMRANLDENLNWIDSSLVKFDKAFGGASVDESPSVESFMQVSEAYADLLEGKDDDKKASVLMKAAGLAKTVGDHNKSLRLYYRVAELMQDHSRAPTALFMMAFIYENDKKDLDKAKSTYEQFLERYPDDPDYADDAKHALKYLGMSPEEVIKQFEQNPQ